MSKSGYALTGDWNRLRSFLKDGQEMIDLVNDVLEEEANKLREAVQNEIPFYQVPNAQSTVRRKGQNSPLHESGVLQSQGIVVNEYGSRDRGFKKYYVVEGNKDLKVESGGRDHNGINYSDLLTIMENGGSGGKNGSVNIPPRPVLTITFNRFKSSLEKEIIAKAKSAIHEALR